MNRNLFVLALITASVWISIFSIDNNLHIIACDVGQGDAILIQKNTTQILIDSGANNKVLDCLGRHLPFGDKQIELAISTHQDKDHSGGFVDVFRAYKIDNFLTYDLNDSLSDTLTIRVLRNEVGGSDTKVIIPTRGMVIRVGLIQLDILHPEGKFETLNSKFETKNTNDTSIVTLLKYAQFRGLFMGDLELNISERLFEDLKIGSVDYIKISHHGSKNGTSEKLLELLRPKILSAGRQVAVISVGKNSYGHPDQKVIEMLNAKNINIRRTDLEGDVDYEVNY